jgi:hypothetical protein
MRKSILACVALTAALVLALSAGAWADVAPTPGSQDIGQLATNQQGASSTATSTQTNPSNQAISVNILSPHAATGDVTQTNSSAATSSAGNTNGTTQTAEQAGSGACCGGTQAIGQAAGSSQEAGSHATSTQTNPSNQAISVNILSPGAGSGDVTQSNDSSATSSAGNTNGTTQTAQQAGGSGCCGGTQAIGQEADNHQGAWSDATSTQTNPSNQAISVSILSPGAGGGDVTQSNSSSANSSAGNTNGTTQTALQASGAMPTVLCPTCHPCTVCTNPCPTCHPATPGIQGIGQLAQNDQHAGSHATSDQSGASNVAAPVDLLGFKPHDDHPLMPVVSGGNVNQSNSSSADSSAGNTNGTTQTAGQWAGGCCGGVQAIGQAAFNAQHAMSDATSTQWCPSNLALGSFFGNLTQSNASAAISAAGNTNGTSQGATQA